MSTSNQSCADRYLTDRHLSRERLAGMVRPLAPDECLILCGSVAEGLANDESDIDLLLIGEAANLPGLIVREADIDTSTIMLPSGVEVSVEVIDPAILERLGAAAGRVLVALDNAKEMQRLELLKEGEQKLLHRIRTGIVLAGEDVLEGWRHRLHVNRLPEIMASGRLIKHFARREDAISHAVLSDMDTTSWCFGQSAAEMAGAALAVAGETYHGDRWIPSLLRRHDLKLGEGVGAALTNLMLDRITTVGELERGIEFLDLVFVQVADSFPKLLPAYERLASVFPVRTHVAAP